MGAIFSLSLNASDCFAFWTAFDELVIRVFLSERGRVLSAKFVYFPSLKILDPPKKNVASSRVSTVGEDTKTMRVLMEDDIPVGGECITLLYSMQVIAFNINKQLCCHRHTLNLQLVQGFVNE